MKLDFEIEKEYQTGKIMNKRQRKKRDKKNRELMLQFCEGLKNLGIAAKECAYNIRQIFKPKDGNVIAESEI